MPGYTVVPVAVHDPWMYGRVVAAVYRTEGAVGHCGTGGRDRTGPSVGHPWKPCLRPLRDLLDPEEPCLRPLRDL